jgi:hypothetical protein
MEFDSLYFLSTKNNMSLNNFTIKKGVFGAVTLLNFDNCIQHLAETDRMKIITSDSVDNFITNYPNIYYDDDEHKTPIRDVLYRKINNFYYVKNDDYFEKYTNFYFKLYSTIFSFFGLKHISMEINDSSTIKSDLNVSMDAIVAKASVGNNTAKYTKNTGTIEMTFQQNSTDLSAEFNNSTYKIDYLHKKMPQNLQNNIYHHSIELDIIQKRTIKNLLIFDKTQKIENTDINKVEVNLQQTFNLTSTLGLFASSSNEKIISQEVFFNISFYDVEIPSIIPLCISPIPTAPIPIPIPTEHIPQDRYIMDFYISKGGVLHSPWPTKCNEIKVVHNISSLNEAKNEAKKEITKHPVHHIIEIVEYYNVITWTYSVKTFKILDNITADIHVGKGRRYIAFDNTTFKHHDHIISRLKHEGYY